MARGESRVEESVQISGLTDVLEAVVSDADKPHPHRDRWIPSTIDDPVKVARREPLEHPCGALMHRVEVVQKQVRLIGLDGCDIFGGVPVADIGRVGLEPETWSPVVADPDLIDIEELSDVVVLDVCDVPYQPGDGVRSWCRDSLRRPASTPSIARRASGGTRP